MWSKVLLEYWKKYWKPSKSILIGPWLGISQYALFVVPKGRWYRTSYKCSLYTTVKWKYKKILQNNYGYGSVSPSGLRPRQEFLDLCGRILFVCEKAPAMQSTFAKSFRYGVWQALRPPQNEICE